MESNDLVLGTRVKKSCEMAKQKCFARGWSRSQEGRESEGDVMGKGFQCDVGGGDWDIVR